MLDNVFLGAAQAARSYVPREFGASASQNRHHAAKQRDSDVLRATSLHSRDLLCPLLAAPAAGLGAISHQALHKCSVGKVPVFFTEVATLFFFFCLSGEVSMVLSLPTIVLAVCWKLLFQRGFFWQQGDLYANKCAACSFEPERGLLSHSLFRMKEYQVCDNDFHEEGSANSAQY